MKYIHFFGNNGYCGTDYHEFMELPDDTTVAEIEDISSDLASSCAESYAYLHMGWQEDFESEEDEQEYYDNANGHCGWEELTKDQWEEAKEMYG